MSHLRLVKNTPEAPPEQNTYLPREFRLHAMKLSKDATKDDIDSMWVDSKLKSIIKSPTGRFKTTKHLLEDADKMGLPKGLSTYEILRIQELLEYKEIEDERRQHFSKIYFDHENASWKEIYEESEKPAMELERNHPHMNFAAIAVEVLDNYDEVKYLHILDYISEHQTRLQKLRLLTWRLRGKLGKIWEHLNDPI